MNNLKNQFRIVVLEDNEFYNTILTRQIKKFTTELSRENGYDFEINSYINSHDCLRNLKSETDIAILDYYLGENTNASSIIDAIREKCGHCRVVIISQFKNFRTYYQTLNHNGVYHFIFKDRYALSNCCSVIADIVKESVADT